MANMLYSNLVSMFGRRSSSKSFEAEMLTYAKTEYKDDWQYAFEYMKTHDGRGPRAGVYN